MNVIEIHEDDIIDFYENLSSYSLMPRENNKTKTSFFITHQGAGIFNLVGNEMIVNNIFDGVGIEMSYFDMTIEPPVSTSYLIKHEALVYFILKFVESGGVQSVIYESKTIELAEAIAPILKYAVEDFKIPYYFTQKEDFERVIRNIREDMNNQIN
jgi:hypothetical protein